jgi:hypothetical protein
MFAALLEASARLSLLRSRSNPAPPRSSTAGIAKNHLIALFLIALSCDGIGEGCSG